jgi:hypothetical protein
MRSVYMKSASKIKILMSQMIKNKRRIKMVYPKITKSQVEVPLETPYRTLFVCVSKTYGTQKDGNPLRLVSLDDCARGYWTNKNMASAHAEECDWLFAHKNQRIVGVFKINHKKGWVEAHACSKPTWPSDIKNVALGTRKGALELTLDEGMTKKFSGKVVHLGRCQNPLRGYFMK